MQIIENSIMQPSDLVLLGFKEIRNKMIEEVTNLIFEQNNDAYSVVLTDFTGEKHIFFIDHKNQQLRYFRPFDITLDSILFNLN